MVGIGKEQRRSLVRARRTEDPGRFLHALYEFITEKEPQESIHPEWAELYDRWRSVARREKLAPRGVLDEIEDALKTVPRTDKEIKNLSLQPQQKLAILLGAGASAPEPSSIPTVLELLPELWRRAKKIGRDDIDKLSTWCESHDIIDIEDLLTAAYIANFSAKNPSVTGLLDYFLFPSRRLTEEEERSRYRRSPRDRAPQVDISSIALFQETLQTLFGLLMSTMIPAKPNSAHKAIADLIDRHRNTSIITTNYDGCIDEALINANVLVNTQLEDLEDGKQNTPQLVKMHGSINWSYCDSCQEVREFDLLEQKRAFEKDQFSYAVIGICMNCGGQRRPLLVPPLAFKFIMFPNLISIWNSAKRIIEDADWIFVVGYSFSEADTYISKIISRSMTAHPSQKMIICDTDTQLTPSLRDKFKAHIDDFDEKRILGIVGNCDKELPPILENLVKEEKASASKSVEKKPRTATSKKKVTSKK